MNDSMEYSTPKIDGQGDCLKRMIIRKRQPVPSSRKFNARVPRDDTMKAKLEKAITDMKTPRKITSHSCIQKANTIAEITPTKSRVKRPRMNLVTTPSRDGSSSDITLFATPRAFEVDTIYTRCPRQKAVCLIYQRLMLCAWRRYKTRLRELTKIFNQQQNRLSQLEMQIEVLSTLRNSESEKRSEALNECNSLKLKVEDLEFENANLHDEIKSTRDELDDTKSNLVLTREDLKHCSEQLKRLQGQLKKKMEEKMDLIYKLTEQDRDLAAKDVEIKKLDEQLKTTTMNLHNSETNFKNKQDDIAEVLEQLQSEVSSNQTLREELNNLKELNKDLEEQSRFMESELSLYVASCEQLTMENTTIRTDLDCANIKLEEEKNKWFAKVCKPELGKTSADVLKHIGKLIIPFVLKTGIYF